MRRALGLLVLALALVLALPAAASAAETKRKPRCAERAVVKGERVCLKLNTRCDRRARSDYLRVGLDCVRRGGYRLVRASAAAKRRGRVIALPTSGIPTFRQALYLFDSQVAALPGVAHPEGRGRPLDVDHLRPRLPAPGPQPAHPRAAPRVRCRVETLGRDGHRRDRRER